MNDFNNWQYARAYVRHMQEWRARKEAEEAQALKDRRKAARELTLGGESREQPKTLSTSKENADFHSTPEKVEMRDWRTIRFQRIRKRKLQLLQDRLGNM